MGWTCNTHERDDKYIKNVFGKPEVKTPLNISAWEDSINVVLKGIKLRALSGFSWLRVGSSHGIL
jgi:hypothetical protein